MLEVQIVAFWGKYSCSIFPNILHKSSPHILFQDHNCCNLVRDDIHISWRY